MHLLFIAAILYAVYEVIKTAMTKPLPPNAFENQELYMKDLGSGMGMKQILKNAEKGKYQLPTIAYEKQQGPKDGNSI